MAIENRWIGGVLLAIDSDSGALMVRHMDDGHAFGDIVEQQGLALNVDEDSRILLLKFLYPPTGGGGGGSNDYNDLINKPTLGTAAAKNVGTGSNDVAAGNAPAAALATAEGYADTVAAAAQANAISIAESASLSKALNLSDVPSGAAARANLGLGTVATKNTGTSSGNIPVLDSGGKIDVSVLPALAITDTNVVSSQGAMLALTAEVGDLAVRTDVNKTFILKTAGAGTLSNWQELLTPTDSVISVAGKTGVVTLANTDISGFGTASTHAASDFDATGAAASAQAASLQKTSNLSDLANKATARTNLELGTAATHAATDFDVSGAAATAQTNAEAYTDTETTRAEAAEALKLDKSANLGDLANTSTAQLNLGLGSAATRDVPASGDASSSEVVLGNDSRLGGGGGGGLVSGTITTPDSVADNIISPTATSQKALVLQAAFGQAEKVFEIQDSNGIPQFNVTFSGDVKAASLFVGNSQFFGLITPDVFAGVQIGPDTAANKALVIQGRAAQTANLTEWQDSTGAISTSISSGGNITAPMITTISPGSRFSPPATNDGAAGVMMTADTAATKVLVVQGQTGQTANLQEWQDDAGTLLASVDPSGAIVATSFSGDGSALTGISASFDESVDRHLTGTFYFNNGGGVYFNFDGGTSDSLQYGYAGDTIIGIHGGYGGIAIGHSFGVVFASTAAFYGGTDAGIHRAAVGVIQIDNGSPGGGGALQLNSMSAPSTPSSAALFYSASGEMHVIDDSGNDTLLSPHTKLAPDDFYDLGPGADNITAKINYYLGTVTFFAQDRAERRSAGETVSGRIRLKETFDEFNKRGPNGTSLVKRDWDVDEAARVTAYTARVADHAKRKADYQQTIDAQTARKANATAAKQAFTEKPIPAWNEKDLGAYVAPIKPGFLK